MKILLIILAVSAIITSNIMGTELGQYEYPCHFLREAPVLDGKEEGVWLNIPWRSGFLVYTNDGTKDYAVDKPTCFKAGWTKDSLYILVKCYDSTPDKLKSDTLWDNGIELFFYPYSVGNYFQMVVNVVGRKWSAISQIRESELEWNVKTAIAGNVWIAEIRIPFGAMEKVPAEGEKWTVNIARNSVSPTERFTCWPPLGKAGFHDVKRFGKFIFCGTGTVADLSQEEESLNSKYKEFLSGKIKEIGSECDNAQTIIKTGMKYQNLQKEAGLLSEGWQDTAVLLAEKHPTLEMMSIFLMKRDKLKKMTEDFKYKVQLEELLSKYSS